MRQCFIISQPRAGSTLLQRLLATHPQIQTIGEPWLAIPFVYALREKGVSSEYIHISLAQGFGEFVSKLPGGRGDYFREVRTMLERLQQKVSAPGKTYFLDKTPRYHLILDELAQIFPDAKFLVLWRNPLAVAASILNTWQKGRFDLRYYEQDIFRGPRNILSFVEKKSAAIFTVRYEDLVTQPEVWMQQIKHQLRYNNAIHDQNGTSKHRSLMIPSNPYVPPRQLVVEARRHKKKTMADVHSVGDVVSIVTENIGIALKEVPSKASYVVSTLSDNVSTFYQQQQQQQQKPQRTEPRRRGLSNTPGKGIPSVICLTINTNSSSPKSGSAFSCSYDSD